MAAPNYQDSLDRLIQLEKQRVDAVRELSRSIQEACQIVQGFLEQPEITGTDVLSGVKEALLTGKPPKAALDKEKRVYHMSAGPAIDLYTDDPKKGPVRKAAEQADKTCQDSLAAASMAFNNSASEINVDLQKLAKKDQLTELQEILTKAEDGLKRYVATGIEMLEKAYQNEQVQQALNSGLSFPAA